MLVECGFVRATAADGTAYTFTPSIGRIADLGTPHEIVALFAALHGPDAAQAAAYVLACLCDQEGGAAPLIGWHDEALAWHDGDMTPAERVIVARHLMQHGIAGRARPDGDPGAPRGQYVDRFDAAQFIAVARVHLGMSSADAAALSMTELQDALAIKFPDSQQDAQGQRRRDVPTRAEYEAAMARHDERARR